MTAREREREGAVFTSECFTPRRVLARQRTLHTLNPTAGCQQTPQKTWGTSSKSRVPLMSGDESLFSSMPPKVSGMSLVWLFLSFPPFLVGVVSLVFTFLHPLPFISPITCRITSYNYFSTFSGLFVQFRLNSLCTFLCTSWCCTLPGLVAVFFSFLFFLKTWLKLYCKNCWMLTDGN